MKKLLYISSFALLALTACDYNAQFDGLEDSATLSDVKTLEYTMTDADYAACSNRVIKGWQATITRRLLLLLNLKSNLSSYPCTTNMPLLFGCQMAYCEEASAVKLTYNLGALSKRLSMPLLLVSMQYLLQIMIQYGVKALALNSLHLPNQPLNMCLNS